MAIVLALVMAVGGCIVLFTAPSADMNEDISQIQAELEANRAYLEQKNTEPASSGSNGAESSENVISGNHDSGSNVSGDNRSGGNRSGGNSSGSNGSGSDESAGAQDGDSLVTGVAGEECSFTAIGDSVMLGAAPEILALFPDSMVDAEKSRQVWDAPELIRKLKEDGKLQQTVIIGLGMNSNFTKFMGQKVLDAIGSDHLVCWILPYGGHLDYLSDEEATLEDLQSTNANLYLLDWPSEASAHPDWFYSDGIHLNESGQKGYAEFLQKSLRSLNETSGE